MTAVRCIPTMFAASLVALTSPLLHAQAPPAPRVAAPVIPACSLMSKDEVKRHLPWRPLLDQFPVEEEALGTYGSACEYPSVRVQVMTFAQASVDELKKKPGLEVVTGVGDEAYLLNNSNLYAELYVKVGRRMLTLQASFDGSMDTVRPGVMSLARALVTKLR